MFLTICLCMFSTFVDFFCGITEVNIDHVAFLATWKLAESNA